MSRFALDLNPRQVRTALDVLAAAVIVSVAFALAGLTWRIAGHAGTGAIVVPQRSAASGAVDVAPALALNPFGRASASAATQATALQLRLTGVIAAEPASLSTAFIAVGAEPANAFSVGQQVGGATIEGILRDRVILNNNGAIEYLAFPDPTLTPQQQATVNQPAAQPGQPGQPAAGQPGTPPPPNAQAATLLTRLNASPAQGGYAIGENPPAGLQQGDVIQTVNGVALNDPAAATAALSAAQASGTATITLMRNGQRITLTVPTR